MENIKKTLENGNILERRLSRLSSKRSVLTIKNPQGKTLFRGNFLSDQALTFENGIIRIADCWLTINGEDLSKAYLYPSFVSCGIKITSRKTNKDGVVNSLGEPIIQLRYDLIEPLNVQNSPEGWLLLKNTSEDKKDLYSGLANEEGNVVIEANQFHRFFFTPFHIIASDGNHDYARSYKNLPLAKYKNISYNREQMVYIAEQTLKEKRYMVLSSELQTLITGTAEILRIYNSGNVIIYKDENNFIRVKGAADKEDKSFDNELFRNSLANKHGFALLQKNEWRIFDSNGAYCFKATLKGIEKIEIFKQGIKFSLSPKKQLFSDWNGRFPDGLESEYDEIEVTDFEVIGKKHDIHRFA